MTTQITPAFEVRMRKSQSYGNEATTVIDWGADHEIHITTYKRHNGAVCCVAQEMEKTKPGQAVMLVFGSQSWSKMLCGERATATEKTVARIHAAGIEKFKSLPESELPSKKEALPAIEIGQVFYTDGPWAPRRRAVYEIVPSDYGTTYKTVELDGSDLHKDQHPRHESKKFGIGLYWKTGDTVPVESLEALVKQASDAVAKRYKEEREKEAAEAAERLRKIEAGKAMVGELDFPYYIEGVEYKTEYRMDDSHDTTVLRKVVLAFSWHKVRNRAELAAAASNCPDTAHLTAESYDEHNSSLGSKYNGWQVRKRSITSEVDKESIYIAAADGNFFVTESNAVHTPANESGAESSSGARIVHNRQQDGIEIHFSAKPSQGTLDTIKANGFRWSKFNKCWYKKDSEGARRVAANYGELPESLKGEQSTGGDAFDNMIIDQQAQNMGLM